MEKIDNTNKIHNYIKNFLKSGEFYLADEDIEVMSYSGRGMDGKKCLGIICNNPVELQGKFVGEIILHIIDKGTDNITDEDYSCVQDAISFADDVKVALIRRVEWVPMGTRSIIYWKDIPYTD